MDPKEELRSIAGQVRWLLTELEDLEKIADPLTCDVVKKMKMSLGLAILYADKHTGV